MISHSDFLPLVDLEPIHERIRAELDEAWSSTTRSHAFVLGPLVEKFEEEWAEYCGVGRAIGVGSGTDAIELGLRAMGIGRGDEVIVPASTFVASAAAVAATGAVPVFTDVDPATMLITAPHVEAAITPRTSAALLVHLFGNPVDIEPIEAVARRAGIALVEDAAQAHGASIGERRIGSMGAFAAFSHYPTKNLGAFGDGGTVVTDDPRIATRVRLLGNHGRSSQMEQKYELIGSTSRLDGLQAAVLSVKLAYLDDWNRSRREVVQWYDEMLPNGIRRVRTGSTATSAPHLCVVRCLDRDGVRNRLADQGIGSGIHYPDPVPRTRAFGSRCGEFPVAEQSADTALSLPLWPGMSAEQVERVCDALAGEAAS